MLLFDLDLNLVANAPNFDFAARYERCIDPSWMVEIACVVFAVLDFYQLEV